MIHGWTLFLSCLLVLLSSPAVKSGNVTHEEVSAKALSTEFQNARDHGIGIIDARLGVDAFGEPYTALPEGYWQYNVLPDVPASTNSPFEYQDHDGVNVIFVHGYNNNAAQAISKGYTVWQSLMTSRFRVPTKKSIA